MQFSPSNPIPNHEGQIFSRPSGTPKKCLHSIRPPTKVIPYHLLQSVFILIYKNPLNLRHHGISFWRILNLISSSYKLFSIANQTTDWSSWDQCPDHYAGSIILLILKMTMPISCLFSYSASNLSKCLFSINWIDYPAAMLNELNDLIINYTWPFILARINKIKVYSEFFISTLDDDVHVGCHRYSQFSSPHKGFLDSDILKILKVGQLINSKD